METNLFGDVLVMGSMRHLYSSHKFMFTASPWLLWCLFVLTVSWQFTQQLHHLVFREFDPYLFQEIVQVNNVNLLTFKKSKGLAVENLKNDDSILQKKMLIL